MAKIQSKAKRVLAIAIALMMVFGACFTGMVTASAESLVDGLTAVATTSTQGYSSTSTLTTFTDIEGGGVTVASNGSGAYRPFLHNVGVPTFPNGGVTLQFDGFVCNSAESHAGSRGYQAMLIVLSNSATDGEACRLRSAAVPGIVIDAYNGNVDYVAGVGGGQNSHTLIQRVIENNDLIKYANISNAPFTVTFNYNKDGDITVDVAVTGNTATGTASGVLSANKYASVANTNARLTYFSVSALDCNNSGEAISFNYYGYKTLGLAPAFVSDLTTVATLDNMAGYFENKQHWGAVTQGDVTYGMVGNLSGGGVYLDVFQHAGYGSLGLQENLGGWNANWELLLGNYRATGTSDEEGYGKIAIAFQASSGVGNSTIYDNSIYLGIDTTVGTLSLLQSTKRDGRVVGTVNTLATIATDDALKTENIQGKLFRVRWSQTADGENIKVSVVFSDKTVSGTFAKSLLSTVAVEGGTTGQSMNASYAYPALANIYGTTSNAGAYELYIDFYGAKTGIEADYITEARAQALASIETAVSSANSGMECSAPYISDIAGGGAHYAATVQSGYFPYNLKDVNFGAWPTSGFKLAFANYVDTATSGDHGQFYLRLSRRNDSSTTYDLAPKIGNMGIIINTVAGQVELAYTTAENTQTTSILLEDDIFLYENFTGKAFTFEFKLSGRAEKEVQLDITVGNELRTVYLTYAQMTTFPEGHTGNNFAPTNACYIGFSEKQNGNPTCTVDFMGYTMGVLPDYVTKARDNVEVLASLATTPDGRVDTNATETDVKGGGILISGASGYDPYNIAYNFGGWPGDGLKLQFANFVSEVETYSDATYNNHYKFALTLGNTSSSSMMPWKGGNVSIVIDGQAGEVNIVKCYGQQLQWITVATLIDSDDFLYENFTGKAFSFEFKLSGRKANEVQMDVVVGDKKHTGYIDYDVLMAHTHTDGTDFSDSFEYNGEMTSADWYYPTATTLYVGFGGMDNDSKCDFYFLGYTDGVLPDYISEARENLDVLASAEATPDASTETTASNNLTVTDVKGGGVYATGAGCDAYNIGVNFGGWLNNGIKLQFAAYTDTNNTDGNAYKFALLLGNTAGTAMKAWKGGNVAIVIDGVAGEVQLVKAHGQQLIWTTVDVLIDSDDFLYENFTGKAFSYEFKPTNGKDGEVQLIVEVDGKSHMALIDTDVLLATSDANGTDFTNRFVLEEKEYGGNVFYPNETNLYFGFSAFDNDAKMGVYFLGYSEYKNGTLEVGTANAAASSTANIPVSVTTEGVATMTVEVEASADIAGIVAADGVEVQAVLDGTKAYVDVTAAADITGTDVKLFDVQVATDATTTVYAVEAKATEAANAAGESVSIGSGKGAAVVTAVVPNADETKYQATEGAYKIGTLGFGTDTADMAALANDNFVAVEFGTVFFTQKMLGEQELKIGTTKVGGTAQALTVSKAVADGETLPEMFVAILKDKASNTADTVSDGYKNTTYVARSFVRYYDKANGVYVTIYGGTYSAKLANIAQ